MSQPTLRRLVLPTLVTVAVCLLFGVGILANANGDPLAFVLLGTRFSQGLSHGSQGYDGQFAYQIALNPTGAAPFLDVPAYRYQRILYPLLARWLALGQAELIPWTLILLNVTAIGVGTWATERILLGFRVSRWYALAYGLYGGQLLAFRADMAEPLAQGLVQLAVLAWLRQRPWAAVAAFALAALSKETTLIFLAGFWLHTLLEKNWRDLLKLSLASLPFIGWQLFLWGCLGSLGVGSGGEGATAFSPIPLAGWLSIAGASLPAFLLISLVVVPMSILPALAGLYLSGRDVVHRNFHPLIWCLLLNSIVILLLPQSTFREPAAMLRLTQGLAASLLLYGGLKRSRRILNYCYLWLFTNILLVGGVAE